MSRRGTKAAGLSPGYPRVPVPAVEDSLTADPPPYSACVPYSPTVNLHYPDSHSPLLANPSETFPLYGIHHSGTEANPILHDTASSVPFLDVPRGSGNYDTGHIPRTTPYNPQPLHGPSYMADQQNNPRMNAYGWKAIVLQRADAENSGSESSKRKIIIASCVGILIGCIVTVFTGTYILITIMTVRDARNVKADIVTTKAANDLSYNNAYDGRIFDNSRDRANDLYLTDSHKDNSDDLSWKPKNSLKVDNPFLDDKYKDNVAEEPRREATEDGFFRHLEIIEPDHYKEKLRDTLNWEKYENKIPNPGMKVFPFSDKMKDILVIPREKKKKDESKLLASVEKLKSLE